MSAVVEVQMMIRKPIGEVFSAFIDPEITRKFWFTRSSGPVVAGSVLTWEWEMYGASAEVVIEKVLENEFIQIRWGSPQTTVEFHFRVEEVEYTYLVIRNYGFKEQGDELFSVLMDNTGGFTTVVDGAKAWLEHGIALGLVKDKFR